VKQCQSFSFFDPVRLERRLAMLEHTRNRGFFCSLMAACALSSARIRDGALASSRGVPRAPALCPQRCSSLPLKSPS
jgi:hypothetical protein